MLWKYIFKPIYCRDRNEAIELTVKSGYKFLCWNGDILFVVKDGTFHDTNLTIKDIDGKE